MIKKAMVNAAVVRIEVVIEDVVADVDVVADEVVVADPVVDITTTAITVTIVVNIKMQTRIPTVLPLEVVQKVITIVIQLFKIIQVVITAIFMAKDQTTTGTTASKIQMVFDSDLEETLIPTTILVAQTNAAGKPETDLHDSSSPVNILYLDCSF